MLKTSPEAIFVIRCCLDEGSRDWTELRRRAASVSDWQRVVALSQRHRVAALVMPVAARLADEGAMPHDAASGLQSGVVQEAARTARLRLALAEALPAIQSSGAEVIILKGAALVSLVYGDAALRPSDDIDLLCREEAYQVVWDTFVSLGYRTDDSATLPHRHAHDETYFERHFYHPDGLVHIELHVDSIKLGVRPRHSDAIWSRARPIEVGGVSALALGLEDQILMLSVHLHRHGFSRLIWFKDIDLLLRRYGGELDWEMVVAEARAEGAEASLWYTFRFLRKLLDTPFPDEVIARIKPSLMTRWAFGRIWPEQRALNLQGEAKRRAVQFSVLESWRGMIPSLILMGRRREKLKIIVRRLLLTAERPRRRGQ